MNEYSLADIKKELKHYSKEDLVRWYLELIKFKKVNKAFTTFQVFYSHSETQYIELTKSELSSAFQEINFTNDFYIKKGLQKINRQLNLILSYPLSDASKIELSIHFLMEFNRFVGRKKNHTVIYNIYLRVLAKLEKWVAKLHEDLQFDFEEKLNELRR